MTGELDDEFEMDLGLGIAFPTLALTGVLVLVFLFWPALWALMNGAIVEALIVVVVAVVLVAIATLYIVGPALVGSYLGGFLGELIAT